MVDQTEQTQIGLDTAHNHILLQIYVRYCSNPEAAQPLKKYRSEDSFQWKKLDWNVYLPIGLCHRTIKYVPIK